MTLWEKGAKRALRNRIKLCIAGCLYYGGLVKLLRWWMEHSEQHLIILNYHCATGGDLRSHLLYLRQHYRLLHLEEALEELYAPHKEQRRHYWHRRRTPLVVTFDDGYRDNYTYGFTLARELEVPVTIFLIPGYMESQHFFWWQEAHHLVNNAQVDNIAIEGRTYNLLCQDERNALIQTIDAHVRNATSVVKREEFLDWIRNALVVPPLTPVEDSEIALRWSDVQEMEESGWVTFGAHTMHHPILAYMQNVSEVLYEVSECRRVIERKLGHRVRTFAYPVGAPEHIGTAALRAVQNSGYDWAVTTVCGINIPQQDPYLLRRVETDVDRHWLILAAEIVGIWQPLSMLLKHFLHGDKQRKK